MMPPWLYSSCDAIDHPHACFGWHFAGHPEVCSSSTLVHGHAFGNQFIPAEHAVDHAADLGVVLKAAVVATSLVVEHNDVCPVAYFFVIAEVVALSAY